MTSKTDWVTQISEIGPELASTAAKAVFLALLASGCDPGPANSAEVPSETPGDVAVEPPQTNTRDAAIEPPQTNTTDVDIEPLRMNTEEMSWKGPVGSLPPGAQISVIEGAPPFAEGRSFMFRLKFPANYTIAPHWHPVTERVTVISGGLLFATGEKIDKEAMVELGPGGQILIPAKHPHYAMTTEETVVQLQGVGPWGIVYLDAKDDPRQTPPPPVTVTETTTDAPIEPFHTSGKELAWKGPVKSLPPGAQISVLEGKPPFPAGQSFVFRLKFPDGYKIPPHWHLVTERVTVISGKLLFGVGDTWDEAAMKTLGPNGVVLIPKEHKHFAMAKGETVVQLQGVGPWGIVYVNPDDDPRQ